MYGRRPSPFMPHTLFGLAIGTLSPPAISAGVIQEVISYVPSGDLPNPLRLFGGYLLAGAAYSVSYYKVSKLLGRSLEENLIFGEFCRSVKKEYGKHGVEFRLETPE